MSDDTSPRWSSWRPSSAFWFLFPAGLALTLVYAGPLAYAFHASFTAWSLVVPGSDKIYIGLENYQDVLGSREYWRAVIVTLSYALTAVAMELVLGTAFALLLNLEFFGRTLFRSLMVIPMVLTPAVIGIFFKLLYEQESGIFNYFLTALGLPRFAWLGVDLSLFSIIIMDVWQTTPFFMLIIFAGLQSIDENVISAARVDGATGWQLLRYITLPFLAPYMLIAAAFRTIAAMGDFDKIFLTTSGGPGDITTTMSIFAFKTGFNAFDIGRTTAIALVFVVIVLCVSAPLLWFLFKTTTAEKALTRMAVYRHRTLRRLLLTVMWTAIALIYLFPYTWMVMTGFRNPIDTLSLPPRFIFSPTLDGFRYIFTNTGFQHYLFNSIVVTVSSTTLVIAIASLASYGLAHLTRRRGFLLTILITRMVPGVAVVVPFYLVASKLGQLDTYHVLILIFTAFNLPFAIWLLRSFFKEIAPELREAAIIDGCTEFGVFVRIMLPLAMGGIIATGVFVFIAAWNEFLFALVLTNSRVATAPLAILGFRTEYGNQWAAIGAAALLISTPVIVFALLMQKYLVRGLTMGSIR